MTLSPMGVIGHTLVDYVAVAVLVVLVYIGLAVLIALFHHDGQRRRDGRAVLTVLIRLFTRNRR